MSKAWSIKYGILTAIFLVLFGLQALANEAGTIREFDSTKGNEPMLIAFLKEMPKGG